MSRKAGCTVDIDIIHTLSSSMLALPMCSKKDSAVPPLLKCPTNSYHRCFQSPYGYIPSISSPRPNACQKDTSRNVSSTRAMNEDSVSFLVHTDHSSLAPL